MPTINKIAIGLNNRLNNHTHAITLDFEFSK